jgi:hypothetical protein
MSQLSVVGRGLAALAVSDDVIYRTVLKGVDLVAADLAGGVTLEQLSPELEREETWLDDRPN